MTELEFKKELKQIKPNFVYKEDDDTIVYEFIKEQKKVSFFVGSQIEYLISWGQSIHNDMQMGIITNSYQINKIIEWLEKND